LEYYGGFSNITSESHPRIASSLPMKGMAVWKDVNVTTSISSYGVTANLKVCFPEVNWRFLKQIYGWSITQWQGWIRGHMFVNKILTENSYDYDGLQSFLLYAKQVIEVVIDGQRHWGGDLFSYKRSPLVLWLSPGKHLIELRLVRDVRSMGGIDDNPSIDVALELNLSFNHVEIHNQCSIIPEVVNHVFSGQYGSMSITNTHPKSNNLLVIDKIYSEDVIIFT